MPEFDRLLPHGLPVTVRHKAEHLLAELRGLTSCLVAFSGGIDSAVLAKAAHLVLGERVLAVTAVMRSMATGRLVQCRETAEAIGVPWITIDVDELADPLFRQNDPRRCYHCKRILFTRLKALASERGLAAVVDGTNVDDLGDYRPGSQALAELEIRSPLVDCGLTKAEVRLLAEAWGIPEAHRPATTCLSTRIAYGLEVTPERLRTVDQAEQFLRLHGFTEFRVRYHPGEVARIEVPPQTFARFLEPGFRSEVIAVLKQAGFRFVTLDLEGFRSGSMNVLVSESQTR